MDFAESLARLGFTRSDERTFTGGIAALHTARPNEFMTYSVYSYEDGTALFSWEFALGEYLARRGIQVGSDEALNQFIYPREDVRGRQDAAWLVGAIERTEAMLGAVRLDRVDL
jgi:hypothetical protein